MSELINNREHRQRELAAIIRELHAGKSVDEVKARFQAAVGDITGPEIAAIEQRLIAEGLPEAEVKRLCDVHVQVFKEALAAQRDAEAEPGHPVHTFMEENAAISRVCQRIWQLLSQLKQSKGEAARQELLAQWQTAHAQLLELDKHYLRKENILFPFLERYGISGPPSVMWSIHDDIRRRLKQISQLLAAPPQALEQELDGLVLPTLDAITEMVYKENKILFPMCLQTLTEAEWQEIRAQEGEIGYCLIEPPVPWQPLAPEATPEKTAEVGTLSLDTGTLTPEQLNLMLNHLPIDITFVDQDNIVRYYSKGKERDLSRTPAIIGRRVEKCHPPESVHVVQKIVEDFRANRRDQAEFWLNMQGKMIYIRYFAVRDAQGTYRGVLEVSQDITQIKGLTGEKRLLEG